MAAWPRKILFRVLAVLLGTVAMLVVVELAGRVFLGMRPGYEVLFLEPDRLVGWKHVPENRFTWTGVYWYAADFSVDVATNSMGFRDAERSIEKPEGTVRIAVLGDSFIEALQVPFERTATQLLETKLEAADPGVDYEVMNFGVSNHGIGQALLVWEAYVRQFRPDYVFVFVAEFLIQRTAQRYEDGAFPATRSQRLWVRPTFRLENGELVLEPARDFDAFVLAQERLLRTRFRNGRSRVREQSLLGHLLSTAPSIAAPESAHAARPKRKARQANQRALVELNVAVLRELGRSVGREGGELVVVDATGFFVNGSGTHTELAELCAAEGFGYAPAYQALQSARDAGHPLRWRHDGHLDEKGNEVLAQAMWRWMSEHLIAREK